MLDRFSLVVYCRIELETPSLVRYGNTKKVERSYHSQQHIVVLFHIDKEVSSSLEKHCYETWSDLHYCNRLLLFYILMLSSVDDFKVLRKTEGRKK